MVFRDARDHFKAGQDDITHEATRRACRGDTFFNATPAELRGHGNGAHVFHGLAALASFRTRFALLREHQVARMFRMQDERRPVGDAQHDNVLAGYGFDSRAGASGAL
jgi:hypothetical protein